MKSTRTALLALLLSSSGSLGTCPAAWTLVTGPAPPARAAHGMAYDTARRQTVAFGGVADIFGTVNLGDTWGFDGSRWTRLAATGPEPRRDGFLAYDAARGRVVLFGGTDTERIDGNRYFPETWEWDGATWRLAARVGPPGRSAHGLAYDERRRRVVLFGGMADHVARPNDVWEWDGAAWTRVDVLGARPSARLSPLFAYDARRGRLVLFGGLDGTGPLSDTWEFDGSAWTRREIAPPPPAVRNGAALAYDAGRGAVVLFGGADENETSLPGVWELDDAGWHLREAGPTARIAGALAYDAERGRLVLFGGLTRAGGVSAETFARRAPADAERLVPIALDVATATAHYTTELSLTNRGDRDVEVTYRYTASLGEGSGSVTDRIPAGRQVVVPDVLAALRAKGLRIPPTAEGAQAGTLLVSFPCAAARDAVSVTARTTTPTVAPLPAGSAGLAYGGLPPSAVSAERLVVNGLRVNAADRSNVAVYAASDAPVTLRITAISGAGDGTRATLDEAAVLGPYEWRQLSFGSTGLSNGSVLVERVGGSGTFGAYGVVNDNVTNDGSFVESTAAAAIPATAPAAWVVPVLVETPRFGSELVLANRADAPLGLELSYRESLGPAGSGSVALTLAPGEQRIVPSAIEFLRRGGVPLGTAGDASRAGALRVRVASGPAGGLWLAARTASPLPSGGQFGLFTPAIAGDAAPAVEGIVPGLRQDAATRSNAGFVNLGGAEAGDVTLSAWVVDGADGLAKGEPFEVVLEPGAWSQLDGVLAARGVTSGWLRVRRVSGSAPWLAYGVLNDGGSPGERTGDGAYVPMLVPGAP